ncbi:uncharacterized protein [Heterodontus francisci]|uniref:uncharacterized protein n=1 Tax=Heterodontus francisci TaxID=7792 RepID=UPI00355B94A7
MSLDRQCSGAWICISAPTEDFLDCRVTDYRTIMWIRHTPLLIIIAKLKWSYQDTMKHRVPEIMVEEESNITLTCTLKASTSILGQSAPRAASTQQNCTRYLLTFCYIFLANIVPLYSVEQIARVLFQLLFQGVVIEGIIEPMSYHHLVILWLVFGEIRADSVSQPQTTFYATEGESVKIDCSYTTNYNNPDLYWYRQHSNQVPHFILHRDNSRKLDADFVKGRFQAGQTNSEKIFPLTITGLEIQDAAVYFCGLSSTVG